MPGAVVDENPHLSHLTRSDSLRSSQSSVDKRVSFNSDVRIKRIPKKSREETSVEIHHEPISPENVESETAQILSQLEGIECSVSANKLYGLHALNNLDIAVNGKEVNSMPSYAEIRRNSLSQTPEKPPRKNMTHYAQPAVSGLHSDLESISSDLKSHRKRLQESLNEDSAIASGGDADDSTVTSSYTSRFVQRQPQRREKMSPSRTCMTDSEILRSPTEVLYAVSEKQKNRAEIPPPPRQYRPRSSYTYSSREDLVSHPEEISRLRSTSENHRYKVPKKAHHSSRSLDRLQHDEYEANKENTFKTRIQVISPDSQHMIQNGMNRKPYKTTINTATDNILYRGNSSDNLSYYHYGENGSHYKIPKSRPIARNYENGSPYRNSLQRPPSQQQQFQSTRLVRNMQDSRGRVYDPHHQPRDNRVYNGHRNRSYSGHSTSPDRDGSPERAGYRQRGPPQTRSYITQRSPSTSPSRPPRSRSSPTREMAVRREHSRRSEMDRSPSVMTNGGLRERSRESNSRRSYVSPSNHNSHHEDRLSKFTEYRGEDIIMPHAQDPNGQPRRATQTDRERGQSLPPGATIENIRDFYKSSQYKSMYQLPPSPTRPAPVLERRNTRMSPSAGPRVSISEGDVTDEGQRPPPEKMPRHRRPVSTSALRPSSSKRQAPSPPVAPSTGKGLQVVRRVVSSDGRPRGQPPINSNVQKAPSMRRIVVGSRRSSVDNGLDSSFSESEGFNGETDQPRPWSSLSDDDLEDEIEYVLAVTNGIVNGHEDMDRPRSGILSTVSAASSRPSTSATIVHVHSQPPVKIMPSVHRDPSIKRAPSVVFHENPTSYHTIIKDKQPLGDFGRRWSAAATPHSDIDSDYRRELATNGSGLHQEARSRDGGLSWAGNGRLSRGSSKNNVRQSDEPDIILRSPSTTDLERSNSNSAREEERRKVLEIEGVINRQPPPQLRAGVSRSASRASRTAHVTNAGPRGYKPVTPRHLSADMADRESQYSGHSSSQTVPLPGPNAGSKLNRFDQHRVGVSRVRRSTSNATNVAAVGGVRGAINQRKTKLPGGSLTSSVNSSESEQGSHAGQSAVSRNTARSNRSVFLHAAAVADIPSPGPEVIRMPPAGQANNRSLSAESRDNLNSQQHQNHNSQQNAGPPQTNSNLKNSKKISRSISLLAPWKPRPVQDKFEIHYDNGNLYSNPATRVTVEPGNMPPATNNSKPPRPPTAPPPPPTATIRRNPSRADTKLTASSTNLLSNRRADRDDSDTTPAVILAERKSEAEKKNSKVSRSVSMPKDSRLAGWFKKRKRFA